MREYEGGGRGRSQRKEGHEDGATSQHDGERERERERDGVEEAEQC